MEDIVYWDNMELVVRDMKQSHVNGGRLGKFWVEDRKSGRVFMVKGSSTFSYEPFSEKIAYIVGKNLGLDILKYDIIPVEKFKGILPIKSYCGYVSICEKVDKKNFSITSVAEIKRAQNAILEPGAKPVTNKEVMYKILPQKYIDTMFLFDAVIGNNDRHYGNVHILRGINGELVGAPILDNGASLLANNSVLTALVLGYKVGEVIDGSSTIEDKHMKQIMHATTLNGINFNIPLKTIEIFEELQSTFDLMPNDRVEAIKKYLAYRLHKYLGIIKNKEIPSDGADAFIAKEVKSEEKEHT